MWVDTYTQCKLCEWIHTHNVSYVSGYIHTMKGKQDMVSSTQSCTIHANDGLSENSLERINKWQVAT